jgi:hypothetical protein
MRGRLNKIGVFLLAVGVSTVVLGGAAYLSFPGNVCVGRCASDRLFWRNVLVFGGVLTSVGAAVMAYGTLKKAR